MIESMHRVDAAGSERPWGQDLVKESVRDHRFALATITAPVVLLAGPTAVLADTSSPPPSAVGASSAGPDFSGAIGFLVITALAVGVVGAAMRFPLIQPLVAFALVTGLFGFVAFARAIGVGFAHMDDTSWTDAHRTRLAVESLAIFVVGLALGGLAARVVWRFNRR